MRVNVILQSREATGVPVQRSYVSVEQVEVLPGGIHALKNINGQPIALIPMHSIVLLEIPEHDTSLSMPAKGGVIDIGRTS